MTLKNHLILEIVYDMDLEIFCMEDLNNVKGKRTKSCTGGMVDGG